MAKEYEIAFKLGAKLQSTFSKSFLQATSSMNDLQKEVKDSQKILDDFKVSAANLGKLSLAGIGAGVLAITAGAATVFSAADKFEGAMDQVEASTGASVKEMQELETIAKNLYKLNLGENWDDLAEAVSQVRNVTDLSGKELEIATGNAIAFRDVFKEDVPQSIKTTDTMMKNFGISSDEAFNLLAQGMQNGLNSSDDLLDTVNEYGVYFKNAGFDAETMFGIFESASRSGVRNLDFVGDAMKEFGIIMKEDGDKATNAINGLGLPAEKLRSQFAEGGEGAKEAFETIMGELAKIKDPLKRNQLGVELFGTKFEDLEVDAVLAMANVRSEFDMTKATMEEIKDVKYDSVGKAIQGIGRQFELGVLIPVGDKVLPKLQEFSEYISQNMPAIEQNVQEAMTTAGDWFEKFGDAISWVKDNSDELIQVTGFLIGTFVSFKVISTAVALWKTYQAALGTATIAQFLMNNAMAMNPIGAVAIGIGALIAGGIALYQNWDTVKAKAGELWDSVETTFGNIGSFIGGVWDGVESNTKNAVNSIIGGINSLIQGANSIKIDIPSWVPKFGGESFGINIPEIPFLAQGGITTGPTLSMIGEGTEQEAVLPLSKLQELIDMPNSNTSNDNSKQHVQIMYNPQYIIQGNASKSDIANVTKKDYNEFKNWMKRYEFEKKRLSFNN